MLATPEGRQDIDLTARGSRLAGPSFSIDKLDARANARAVPLDARLTRGSERAPGAPARWSGAVSLSLPS